jgi:hypothetical protein
VITLTSLGSSKIQGEKKKKKKKKQREMESKEERSNM